VVRVDEVPSAPLGDGQVRVQVAAAAVNFPDVLIVADEYQMTAAPPFTPGSELAGVVTEVGPAARGVAVGDRVSGAVFVGAFAEEVVLDASSVRPVPPGVELAAAAAFGVAHRTAYHSLRSVGRLQPGEELVVLGAGGGVGLAAVQLGVALGATVTAVASSAEKLAVAASLGATHLVEHRATDLRQALKDALPAGADVVVDPVGGALSEPALRVLRPGGRFVTVGFASGEIPRIPLNLVMLKGVEVVGFQFLDFVGRFPDLLARDEAELDELLVAGRATPHIGATYPLDQVAEALAFVGDGRAIGKVLITM
jgi:NADPH2:quinone reductase